MEGFHYVEYDPEETWNDMHAAYINAGGDALYPGDEKEMLLRAVLAIGTAIMAKVDNALKMDTLEYAQGQYLDLYGGKRNCPRIAAVEATATVQIVFQATGRARTMAAGTEMTADGTLIYATTEAITRTGAAQTVEVGVVCRTAGTAGNALPQGTQMQLIQSDPAVTGITVTAGATGGIDEETDEAYRARIRRTSLASVTTGPAQQYESAAMAASAQVLDAKAFNGGAGVVEVLLIVDDDADAEDVIAEVETALSAKNVRPLGDQVTVEEAEAVEYTVNLTVTVSPDTPLTGDIQETVDAWQDWQDNTIGRAQNLDRLLGMLYMIGCAQVSIQNNPWPYVDIGSKQRGKGTVNVGVVET